MSGNILSFWVFGQPIIPLSVGFRSIGLQTPRSPTQSLLCQDDLGELVHWISLFPRNLGIISYLNIFLIYFMGIDMERIDLLLDL